MTPREKVEACFAKARSTTSPHERDNAVTLGIRLAEKAGLSLDLFDIPGRAKAAPKPPPSRYREDLFEREAAPRHYTEEEARDVLNRFAEKMRRQMDSETFRAYYASTEHLSRKFQDAHAAAQRRAEEAVDRRQATGGVTCRMCGKVARECRFGAPCYDCVPCPGL